MIVFLHGVPETANIWDRVRATIGRESLALRLLGFGGARPPDFGVTKDEYVDWVFAELEKIDQPIGLVGHDWGAALTYRIATVHGDKIHSWTADIANALHPDYVWHAFAKIWQTASDGGAFFREQNATPREDRAARYEALGLSHDDALTLASWSDEVMGRCILDLYPSATPNPYSHWRDAWGPTSTPGLIIFPSQDSFGDETMSREVAQQLGAGHETLDDAGHFWPRQAPQAGATILVDFFNLLD